MTHELSSILAIAQRDLLKFLRDRPRLVATFVFPLIFIAALGGSLQLSLGEVVGYDFLVFIFTGIYAQTLFQSATFGIISLIEDRDNDFSQAIFVAPISRYAIIFGKISGESLVALAQGVVIIVFAMLIGVPISPLQALGLLAMGVIVCLFGGAFGVILLANLNSQRAAQQIFPFVMFPQFFLAGVFSPIKGAPFYLDVLSRLTPLRYAVDLVRGLFYSSRPDFEKVVLASLPLNLAIIGVLFAAFISIGTYLFVQNERNR